MSWNEHRYETIAQNIPRSHAACLRCFIGRQANQSLHGCLVRTSTDYPDILNSGIGQEKRHD